MSTPLQHAVAAATGAGDGVAWGVCVRDAESGAVVAEHEPEAVLPTASIGKLLLLVAAARRCAAGEGGEPVDRRDVPPVADSGLWQHLSTDRLPVHDCAALVGAVSDNLATNALVARWGLAELDELAVELGLRQTRLHDVVRDERGPQHPSVLSSGTAGELSDLLARLHRGERAGDAVSAQVLRWLSAGTDLSMVAAAFGLDPLAHAQPDRGVRLVSKTGTDAGVRADVGAVAGPLRSLSYAVLAAWPPERDLRDDVLDRMRVVGRALRAEVGGAAT